MKHLSLFLCVLPAVYITLTLAHQNQPQYAPGVPPPQQQQHHQHQAPPQQQQYQQPPQQQQQFQQGQQQQQFQQGQQQQQYQQQPPQQQQYQQPPQQQQQVNQMHQQPPTQGHGHGHGHGDDSLRFSSDVHNAEHVMEHLENVIDKPKEQMSEEELEFHYFKMHDYDDNNKLDGVEIGKALTHYHNGKTDKLSQYAEKLKRGENDNKDSSAPPPEVKVFSDDEISNIVDTVLKENDLDGDGYIEYTEFKRAQNKEKAAQATQTPPQP